MLQNVIFSLTYREKKKTLSIFKKMLSTCYQNVSNNINKSMWWLRLYCFTFSHLSTFWSMIKATKFRQWDLTTWIIYSKSWITHYCSLELFPPSLEWFHFIPTNTTDSIIFYLRNLCVCIFGNGNLQLQASTKTSFCDLEHCELICEWKTLYFILSFITDYFVFTYRFFV